MITCGTYYTNEESPEQALNLTHNSKRDYISPKKFNRKGASNKSPLMRGTGHRHLLSSTAKPPKLEEF
jgi:hypothetical protein